MSGGEISNATLVSLALNALLGIASIFGAAWLRRMEADMADIRKQQGDQSRDMHEKLSTKVGKDDFQEFRRELRDNFKDVFSRMDALRDSLAEKADR